MRHIPTAKSFRPLPVMAARAHLRTRLACVTAASLVFHSEAFPGFAPVLIEFHDSLAGLIQSEAARNTGSRLSRAHSFVTGYKQWLRPSANFFLRFKRRSEHAVGC